MLPQFRFHQKRKVQRFKQGQVMKRFLPERFEKLEQGWKQRIRSLRLCAAGSYASLEYRRGGLPALEQLAAQRPDDAVFQEKVQETLASRRKSQMKSMEPTLENMVEDIEVKPTP